MSQKRDHKPRWRVRVFPVGLGLGLGVGHWGHDYRSIWLHVGWRHVLWRRW